MATIAPVRTLVVLHGHGGSPATIAPLAAVLAARTGARVSTPRGPVPVDGGWAWWDDSQDDRPSAELLARLGGAASPPDRVGEHTARPDAVIGFSQGGAVALAMAGVARVGCIGGFLATPAPTHGPVVFIGHGRNDAVVDPDYAYHAARRCRHAGCTVTEVWHDGGHEWPDAMTGALADWLTGS